jgi:hypothetical protein
MRLTVLNEARRDYAGRAREGRVQTGGRMTLARIKVCRERGIDHHGGLGLPGHTYRFGGCLGLRVGRLQQAAPLAPFDVDTFCVPGAKGYVDYPDLDRAAA